MLDLIRKLPGKKSKYVIAAEKQCRDEAAMQVSTLAVPLAQLAEHMSARVISVYHLSITIVFNTGVEWGYKTHRGIIKINMREFVTLFQLFKLISWCKSEFKGEYFGSRWLR